MTSEEIKTLITQTGKSVNTIEKDLKIPQGTLGKAMKGLRALPAKWDEPLKKYLKKNNTPSFTPSATLTIEKPEEPAEIIDRISRKMDDSAEKLAAIAEIIPKLQAPAWVTEIEQFCNKQNCVPQDLMNFYNPAPVKKPDNALADMLPKVSKPESYFEKRQREAMGK